MANGDKLILLFYVINPIVHHNLWLSMGKAIEFEYSNRKFILTVFSVSVRKFMFIISLIVRNDSFQYGICKKAAFEVKILKKIHWNG